MRFSASLTAMVTTRFCSSISRVCLTLDFEPLDLLLPRDVLGVDRELMRIRARSTASLAQNLRFLDLALASAFSAATSARCCARRTAISRSCSSRAYSLSRSIASACCSASRFLARIAMIESCSMSLRFFFRVSISSVSRVMPSASKALVGLNSLMSVWSILVSEAVSSSRPLAVSDSATSARTPRM